MSKKDENKNSSKKHSKESSNKNKSHNRDSNKNMKDPKKDLNSSKKSNKSNPDNSYPNKPKKTFLIIYSKKNNDNDIENDLDKDNDSNNKKSNKKDDDDEHSNEDEDENDDEHSNEDEDENDDDDEEYDDDENYEDDDNDNDDEEYGEDDFLQDELLNNQIENKYKRNRDKFNNNDYDNNDNSGRLDNLFHIMGILTNQNDFDDDENDNDNHFNHPKKKFKKNEKDEFLEYFKDAKELIPINKEIKTLKDLIELGESYDPNDTKKYVINLKALNDCVQYLKDLDSMIGMNNVKNMIIDLIFFRLQNFEDDSNELWHLVIQGAPGCGKTEISKIISNIYYGLGIIKKNKFTQAKRSDLIGKYLGHTAKQTQEVFDKASGGVLFIDEAYSLGNPEGRDSFAKECIDTINLNLTENRDTVVFIAGYKEQLDESFFSYNPGLNRRFKMRLTVDKYDAVDLKKIYIKKIIENKWSISEDNDEKNLPLSFFEKNRECFKYNGGDMENLWHLTKIVHARRIFGKSNDLVKKITLDDLNSAFKLYEENDEFKNRDNNKNLQNYIQNTMYC